MQVHQELEEELGRPVSYGEVFMQTHTRADGTFVDAKAKQVAEVYNKSIEERLSELDEDGVDASDDSSQQSTHRTLTIEEKNELFLKCTETDVKGNYFGIGSLKVTLKKGKRKESYASSSSSSITKLHDQLRQKMAEHDVENARIANLERLVMYWKESDPAFAAFVASQPQPTAPATTAAANATATANGPATAATAQNKAEEMAGETNPATAPTGTVAATPTPSPSF
ncbi:uncharacterized protein LOC9308410 [Arabidopsis lyrata subsp. lyrata]|nr:uncharacterized protein LOC9308410 [Arabidopsis lyrata subsp. lyrata]|eukprot:XP_002872341.2 uncharacterized protein LOC9308410 [Arabidopsis lyrata subsp. lyrata]